jgi:MATE family, multidrug efflux pump
VTARGEWRELFQLAMPLSATFAGSQLMSVVDTAVVGHFGTVEVAGLGLAVLLFYGLSMLGTGVLLGFDPLISQAVGAGDHRRAHQLLIQALWLAVIVAAAIAVPMFVLPLALPPVGVEPAVASAARIYLWVRIAGLPAHFLYTSFRAYLQAVGRTRPIVVSMICANVVNAGAVLLFVFGGARLPAWTGPLRLVPRLGVLGAGLSTVIATMFEAALVAWASRGIVRAHVPASELAAAGRRPVVHDLRAAVRIGLPVGLELAADVMMFAVIGVLAARFGAAYLAAHQIAIAVTTVSYCAALGFGAAGSVLVGRAIGARDAARTRRWGILTFVGGSVVMAISSLVLWLIPGRLAGLLTDSAGVIELAIPTLTVAAVFQLFDGIQGIGVGVLRGAGDTRFAMVAGIVGHYAIGLPLAVVFGSVVGLGLVGLWAGLSIGLTAIAVVVLVRFLRLTSRPIAPLEPSAPAARRDA